MLYLSRELDVVCRMFMSYTIPLGQSFRLPTSNLTALCRTTSEGAQMRRKGREITYRPNVTSTHLKHELQNEKSPLGADLTQHCTHAHVYSIFKKSNAFDLINPLSAAHSKNFRRPRTFPRKAPSTEPTPVRIVASRTTA